MESQEFVRRLRDKNRESGKPIPEVFVQQALGEWLWMERPMQSRGDLQACLASARALREEDGERFEIVASDGGPSERSGGGAPSDPTTAIVANRLYDDLEPEVADLRRQLFDGNPDVPFPDWDDAFDWLRQEEADSVRPPGYLEMCEEYEEKIKSLCKEYVSRRGGGEWSFEFPSGPLAYLPSSRCGHNGICRMAADPYQKRLWALWRFVSEKANLTDLGEPSLLAFVLSGQRSWPSVLLNVTAFRWPEGIRFTTIRIPNPTPSWKDFENIYASLRKKRKNKKGLSEINRALVAALGEAGKYPERGNGRMDFWEQVAKTIREDFGVENFTGIMAKKRFDRLPKEIRESFPSID